jgi:hypothetical protein
VIQSWSIILGIGLALLWIIALSGSDSTSWLAWLHAVGALCAFLLAGNVSDQSKRAIRIGSTLALSIGLFGLWIVGLATGAVAWQAWWTFAFACAFLLLAAAAGKIRHVPASQSRLGQREARGQFGRSA